jgi:hypothetical protein
MKAITLLVLLLAGTAFSQARKAGMYARTAIPIWDLLADESGEDRPIRIPSPDRTALLIASSINDRDGGVRLTLRRHGTRIWSQRETPGVGIEAAWAPDSKAFFVTSSGGGRNGFYFLTVFFVNEDAVRELDVTPPIETAFGHPVKCQDKEPPNIAGLKWLSDSSGLIAVAEIVGHSNCDSNGTFRAYQLSLPEGRISGSYDQIEAKRLFGGDLGWEIKNAPDRCILRPKSCWQYFNHNSGR